jgi:hypothetical protein
MDFPEQGPDGHTAAEEAQLAETLAQVQAAITEMEQAGRAQDALSLALQRWDVVRRYHGEHAPEARVALLGVGEMLLRAAQALLADGSADEVADMLHHVDTLTRDAAPAGSALEHVRLWVRLTMDRLLLQARHRQARFRSAATIARKVADAAAGDLYAVWEAPTAQLNLAAALSAGGQHRGALGHSYAAYQAVAVVIAALAWRPPPRAGNDDDGESPEVPADVAYVRAALELERPLNERALDQIDATLEKVRDAERRLYGVPLADTELARRAAEGNHSEALAPRSGLLDAAACGRWGGLMALAYRSIACEQEHLGQRGAALLTFRVSASTAGQALGSDHPVARQCAASLKAAQEQRDAATSASAIALANRPKTAAMRRLPPGRVPGASGVPLVSSVSAKRPESAAPNSKKARGSRAASASGDRRASSAASMCSVSHDGGTTNGSTANTLAGVASRSSASPMPQQGRASSVKGPSASALGRRRPQWNGWFASDEPPPLHADATATAQPRARRLNRPQRSGVPPRSSTSPAAPQRRSESVPDGDGIISPATADDDATLVTPSAATASAPHSEADEWRSQEEFVHDDDTGPVLSRDDLAFLATTYRIRRDPVTRGPTLVPRDPTRAINASTKRRAVRSPSSTVAGSAVVDIPESERTYYALLDDHRRFADEMAQDLGIPRRS